MSDNEDEDEDDGKKPSMSRKDFKQALSKMSRDDLIKLVGDLYSSSPDNRNFLEAKFSSSTASLSPSLKRYKAIIQKNLFPDVMTGTAQLSFVPVRKAISDYKKATGDQKGVLELMVYAVGDARGPVRRRRPVGGPVAAHGRRQGYDNHGRHG